MSFSSFEPADMLAILPEIALVLLAALVMTMDVSKISNRRNLGLTTAIGFFVIIVLTLLFSQPASTGGLIWGGMIRNDLAAFIFRLIFMFAGGMTALLCLDVEEIGQRGDFYAILIGAVIGMNFMAFSADVIMLFLALETTSIAGYVMAGFVLRDKKSAEAGLKYLLFGATASAVMLFGLTLLFGFTGETNIYVMSEVISGGEVPVMVVLTAAVLVIVGVGFKIAIVPFHFWAPDVYEGAPTPVTAFISTASKTAGFAILARIFLAGLSAVDDWLPMLIAMAAVTMTLGNIVALAQRNIKRLLAYSSIAHAGYALVGFVALSELGTASMIFYLMAYVVTNLAAFAVVIIFERAAGSNDIADYAGLSRRSPFLALAMLVAFLSLAGMPPFGGFFAKIFVFAAAVEAGLIWLVVVGALNVIIGLYYYLIVLKVVWVTPKPEGAGPIEVPRAYGFALGVLSVSILVLGTVAGPWFNWALAAAEGIF